MKNMKRLNSFLEKFWLLISIVSVALVVYVYSTAGPDENYVLMLLPIISISMYIFRKRMSKRYDD